jgi:hypothetical protein
MQVRALHLGVAVAAIFCAGCSTAAPAIAPAPPAGSKSYAETPAAKNGAFLYVAGTMISQYRLGSKTPLHSIVSPYGTTTLALDSLGNLFTENGVQGSGAYTAVYNAADLSLERTLTCCWFESLAFGPQNYVYATASTQIAVLRPGGGKRIIGWVWPSAGISSVAFSPAGDLYAASIGASSISIYIPTDKARHVRYTRNITQGIHNPEYLLFDRTGRLFVANCPSCWYSSPPRPDTISIYAPGQHSPERRIKAGLETPVALAVDSKGRLYVANSPNSLKATGWVSVYSAGARKLLRKITQGIDVPASIAIDPSDNVYVANYFAGTVTVYSPGGATLEYTISNGVGFPLQLVIGSPQAPCHIRKTPNCVRGCGACAAASSPMAITRRVSSGSMMPSSHKRAVE